jgi:hypothetical protein
MLRDKPPQRRRRDHRHVAASDQDIAVEFVPQNRDRAARRITRPALLALDRETQIVIAIRTARRRLDLNRLIAHHDDQRLGIERSDRAQHPRDHRLTPDLVKHLRPIRSHPGAKSGGQNHRG